MNLLHPRVNASQLESFRLRNGFRVGDIWALLEMKLLENVWED